MTEDFLSVLFIVLEMSVSEESIELHKRVRGKLCVQPKVDVNDQKMLSLVYTPGVAAVSKLIAGDKSLAYEYTSKWNSIAIVSDGSRVLGLGNIGPEGAMPVMEGKAILYKKFGDVDAIPICISAQSAKDIANVVKAISPTFGGINLEDIDAPKCFEVEDMLSDLPIPVFHDDQHGTAVVVLAGVINSLKVVSKNIEDVKIAVIGAGAAGLGITRLLLKYGAKNIIVCDSSGTIYNGRKKNMNKYKQSIAKQTNKKKIIGTMNKAIEGSDIVIGVSAIPNLISKEAVKSMAEKPIVFALTNPEPEINPEEAKAAGAYIVATGRSDYPNQINNSLVFPGVFRGLLDARATKITMDMKLAAAITIANMVKKPSAGNIVPKTTDDKVAPLVANAVKEAYFRIQSFTGA